MKHQILLVADRNKQTFEAIWQGLLVRGVSVICCSTIEDALSRLHETGLLPALTLADIGEHGAELYAFCRTYRSDFPHSALWLLADAVRPEVCRYYMNQGATQLLDLHAPGFLPMLFKQVERLLRESPVSVATAQERPPSEAPAVLSPPVWISIEPLKQKVAVEAGESLLSAINREGLNVPFLCGGKGLCSTCHVFISAGESAVDERTSREEATLRSVVGVRPNSRLACQTTILSSDLVVEVPEGMYVGSMAELEALVGRRAGLSLLHPVTSAVLIEKGKLILRSTLESLAAQNLLFTQMINNSNEEKR